MPLIGAAEKENRKREETSEEMMQEKFPRTEKNQTM